MRNVAAGDDFTCGTVNGLGTVTTYSRGRNDRIQLGAAFACTTTTNASVGDKVQCWGANEHGQLGRGTTTVAEATALPSTPLYLQAEY